MAVIEIHDAPDSLVRHWEQYQRDDIHIITGPYLRALEALASQER